MKISPTFLLKGIDYTKLIEEYDAGIYDRPIEKKSKITLATDNIYLAPSYGSSNNDAIFSIKDKNNRSVIIATTGHVPFHNFINKEQPIMEQKIGPGIFDARCGYCLQDIEGSVLGYPLKHKESTTVTSDKRERTHTVWIEKHFCDYECTLGYMKLTGGNEDAEQILRFLYYLNYPNEPSLHPANDPWDLINNGGLLTKEQWKSTSHKYMENPKILLIPTKTEYIRKDVFVMMNISHNMVTEIISNISVEQKGRCGYCLQDIIDTCMGYPVKHKETINKYTVWTEKRFCDDECTLGYIKLTGPTKIKESEEAEQILRYLYQCKHNKSLRPANNPWLLISNGGSLTKEQWKSEKYHYIKTSKILMINNDNKK